MAAGAALSCAVFAVACAREGRRPRKTHLARLPPAVTQAVIADDASSFAYVETQGAEAWIVRDGVRGPTFAAVVFPTFSPVTRRLFYFAGDSAENGFVVADGKTLGGEIGREATIVFSADGKRWATATSTRDQQKGGALEPGPVIVFADDREIARHPDASVPTFSPDGRHLAYLVAAEDGARLIVEGAEQAAYAKPAAPCARRAKPRLKGANPNFWPQFQVRYLFDGRLLVMTQDDDGWGVYRDGKRLASYASSVVQSRAHVTADCTDYSAVAAWTLTAAEKAPVVAWWERLPGTDEQWRVVVDGKPADGVICTRAWERQPPELSADGRHLAYACAVREPLERVFLVADGRRYGPYWDMWAYTWADDGAHVAYGAAEAETGRVWRYYVDGEPRSEAVSAVWRPRVEAGTGRLAWESRRDDDGRGMVGIDRRPIASFDDVVWGPAFLSPGTATWVIRRGQRLTRLDAPSG